MSKAKSKAAPEARRKTPLTEVLDAVEAYASSLSNHEWLQTNGTPRCDLEGSKRLVGETRAEMVRLLKAAGISDGEG